MKTVQREHALWLRARGWSSQPKDIPAAGMIEEAGELLHCAVAEARMALFGAESRNAELVAERFDAIGDCFIYFVSFCNTAGWDAARFADAVVDRQNRDEMTLCVDLVRIAADFYASKYVDYAMLYVGTLRAIAQLNGLTLEAVVPQVWAKVRDRCK